jgi:uncharacterized protein (TIGR02145 family)
MQYTVTGSTTTLPAYSKTYTIDAANTRDTVSGIVATFSWKQQSLEVGSGTFNATITTEGTYNAKLLKIEKDKEGIEVATFKYPKDHSYSLGTATLRVMPGIPDRMFGVADKSKNTDINTNTETHKFVYLPVTNPTTGRTWLNNNLGAEYAKIDSSSFKPTQQAKSSTDHKAYGSLFQWGRKADGHELMIWTNGTTGTGKTGTIFGSEDSPDHAKFITVEYDDSDDVNNWRITLNTTLWENEESVNNVCPVGYKLPTAGGKDGINMEWEVEVDSWHTDEKHANTNVTHALASTLKLPIVPVREYLSGSIDPPDNIAIYWSGSTGRYSKLGISLDFTTKNILIGDAFNALGYSVRCIKAKNE